MKLTRFDIPEHSPFLTDGKIVLWNNLECVQTEYYINEFGTVCQLNQYKLIPINKILTLYEVNIDEKDIRKKDKYQDYLLFG